MRCQPDRSRLPDDLPRRRRCTATIGIAPRRWLRSGCPARPGRRSADRGAQAGDVLDPRHPGGLARDGDVVHAPGDGARLDRDPDPQVDLGAPVDVLGHIAAIRDPRGDVLVPVAQHLDAPDGRLRAGLREPDADVVHAVARVADADPVRERHAPEDTLEGFLTRACVGARHADTGVVRGLVTAVRGEHVDAAPEWLRRGPHGHHDLVEARAHDADGTALGAGGAGGCLEPDAERAALPLGEGLTEALVVGTEHAERGRAGPGDPGDRDRDAAAVGDAEQLGPDAAEDDVAEVVARRAHGHVRRMGRGETDQGHVHGAVRGVAGLDLERARSSAGRLGAEHHGHAAGVIGRERRGVVAGAVVPTDGERAAHPDREPREGRVARVPDRERLRVARLDLHRAEVPFIRADRHDGPAGLAVLVWDAGALELGRIGLAVVRGRHELAGVTAELTRAVADLDQAAVPDGQAGDLVAVAVVGDDREVAAVDIDLETTEAGTASVGEREHLGSGRIHGHVPEVVARGGQPEIGCDAFAHEGHGRDAQPGRRDVHHRAVGAGLRRHELHVELEWILADVEGHRQGAVDPGEAAVVVDDGDAHDLEHRARLAIVADGEAPTPRAQRPRGRSRSRPGHRSA